PALSCLLQSQMAAENPRRRTHANHGFHALIPLLPLSSSPRLQLTPSFLNFGGDELFVGQNGPVFSGENFVRQAVERITRDRFVFLAAKDESDRRIFVGAGPVLPRVIEIHVHLACISVSELAAFEIND